jgi:SNF2 family DNA or RNA helicase
VAFNWCDEAARFAPGLRLHVFAEVTPDARAALVESLGAGDVLVVSYGLLVREIARLGTRRFATLVADEAQGLKNASAQRVRAARALSADFKLALSGTPFENHLGELWSLYAVVFPGLLGSWESFRVRFATPIEKKLDPEAAPTLSRMLAPFLLRRTKAQVESELPPRTEVRVPVVLSGPEWQLYEDARLAALSYLEKRKPRGGEPAPERFDVLAALTRLRLAASHPRLSDAHSTLASAKLARLLELVDELRAEGQRALVFSQFTSHLALVREALDARGVPYVYLDGQTPQKLRGERVHEFQEGQAPLFLISLKAGGFGLNLTAASNVIHLDPWWNPAVEDQASDRAHRLGQERPVTIYRMISLGTIEEQMLALHASKRALVAQVLNDGEDSAGATGTIPTDELLALLAERPHFGAE